MITYRTPNAGTELATIIRRWLNDNFRYELEFTRSYLDVNSIFMAKIRFERYLEPKRFITERLELLTLYIDKCVLLYWCHNKSNNLDIAEERELIIANPVFFDEFKKSLNEVTDRLISYGYSLPIKQNGCQ